MLFEQTWCSVGGGFVPRGGDGREGTSRATPPTPPIHLFHDGTSLLAAAEKAGLGFGELVLANEAAWEEQPGALEAGLDRVWEAFRACVRRGLETRGVLPGGLGMRRRAAYLYDRVASGKVEAGYVNIARAQAYAFAVNEENAAGGTRRHGADERRGRHRARRCSWRWRSGSISTAGPDPPRARDGGRDRDDHQGARVSRVPRWAARGRSEPRRRWPPPRSARSLGGTPAQVEYAAEIGMEHNLGLTCDPIAGLVQAPCIERNAMGVAKAWSAAKLALHAEGSQLVSLDRVIRVMKRTGEDMGHEYKETSAGGLAVSLPEC